MRAAETTDVSLVAEMRQGSSAALAALFDRHVDAIFAYCFRRTASWHAAEDATSAVFLEAWRSRARVEHFDGSALPWLYGVARNVCRNADRSTRRLSRALRRLPAHRGCCPFNDDTTPSMSGDRIDGKREKLLTKSCRCTCHSETSFKQPLCRGAARLPSRTNSLETFHRQVVGTASII